MPEVTLPEGMSPEDFEKAFGTFLKQRVHAVARDKATRQAMKDLIAAHSDEYNKSVKKYLPREMQ